MKKTIEKLRQRPKSERQKVTFVSALVITGIIALVWLSLFITDLNSTSQTAQVEDPVSSITGLFKDVFSR